MILLFWSSVLVAVIPSSFITTKVTQNPLNGLVTVKCSIYILFIPLFVISLIETIDLLLKPNETAYDDLIDAWGIFSLFFLVFISFIYYKLSIKINQYASHQAITQVKLR
ncbi:hypothetical protein [Candidatus Hodarchaeum mangrovi]